MLGKLLKHEFIATGRIMGAVYAVVVLAMGYIIGSYYINHDEITVGRAISMMVLIVASLGIFFLTTIIMVTNFQKTLYGDQGYLSFTLPVKSVSLLSSKVIVSVVWFLAAFACVFGTLAITFFVFRDDIAGESYDMIESMLAMFTGGKTFSTIIAYVIIEMISLFIKFAMLTVEVYFAITLANTRRFQKHYLLWTIIFAIVIIFAAEKVGTLISDNVTLSVAFSDGAVSFITRYSEIPMGAIPVDIMSIIISLIFGAVFYYATFYVMSKKVNIR